MAASAAQPGTHNRDSAAGVDAPRAPLSADAPVSLPFKALAAVPLVALAASVLGLLAARDAGPSGASPTVADAGLLGVAVWPLSACLLPGLLALLGPRPLAMVAMPAIGTSMLASAAGVVASVAIISTLGLSTRGAVLSLALPGLVAFIAQKALLIALVSHRGQASSRAQDGQPAASAIPSSTTPTGPSLAQEARP